MIENRLFDAISAEDDALFYSVLSQIENPKQLNVVHRIYTPLSLACAFDRYKFVQALLKKGADVNCTTGDLQQYPIHFAARNDSKYQIRCVELLHEYGADLSSQDADRNTPLYHACASENVLLFNYLLEHGANVDVLNNGDETPLIRAIRSQNQYMVKRLIATGCSVNCGNGEALERLLQVYPPMTECIDLLVQHGADLSLRPYLCSAAANNNVEMIKLLKDHGIDVNEVSGDQGMTALLKAAISSQSTVKIIEILLDWGADVNAKSFQYDTALHFACGRCNLEKVLTLLEFHADVTCRNLQKYTPLSFILSSKMSKYDTIEDFFKICRIIIASGSPVILSDIEVFNKRVPQTLKGRQTEQEILAFLETVKECAFKPRKLLDICRIKVRNCLKAKVCDHVTSLPLPVYLKNFLLFNDILG